MVATVSNAFEEVKKSENKYKILESEEENVEVEIYSKEKNSYDDTLQMRENAARIQYNTHKSILNKLHGAGKISKDLYV